MIEPLKQEPEPPRHSLDEAVRLERLWGGDFGDAYSQRNRDAGISRGRFWQEILTEFPVHSALEVGCNIGGNLRWFVTILPPHKAFGVDINLGALVRLQRTLPGANAFCGAARDLPVSTGGFDLVFTMGVLIHQPESTLPLAMAEIVRCSQRYVLCGEYYAEQTTEVPYRGQQGALFKRDYGHLYQELFPELQLRKQGFLSRAQGWDDVTFWVFEKGVGN